MAKILVSWIATGHDFTKDVVPPKVNPDGPHMDVHRHHWDYDRHLLLSQKSKGSGDPRMTLLLKELRSTFPDHVVEPVFVGLRDVINVGEIRSKVEKLLVGYGDDEIDIFVSPGTPSMMTAWYFVHFGLKQTTRLFHLRPKQFTEAKEQSEIVFESIEQSVIPASLAIRQASPEDYGLGEKGFKLTPSIETVYERARMVAQTDDATCVILGSTGTGKEHLARFIHDQSARREGRFIPVNCSALGTGDLLESRLFGYAAHVFTDQKKGGRAGLFEEGSGGTIFLDEIGDAAPELQQMLLRVLQEKEVTRVGASVPTPVDVRVIGATHRDLRSMCKAGAFRWDLYYRMTLAELRLPDLRDRGLEETKALVTYFLEAKRKKYGRMKKVRLSNAAHAQLEAYSFPGNIRELENLVESLYIFSDDTDEPVELVRELAGDDEASFKLADIERRHILETYRYFGENKKRTARELGIAANTLRKKLDEYGAA